LKSYLFHVVLVSKVAFSSYVEDYIDDTSAIPSHLAGWGLAVLWIAITLGRLGGLRDQMTVESKADLYRHLYLWLLTGGFGCALMLLFPSNEICAWLGIFLYGFGNGPCVGYCYDINNRITIPSEFGMSIVMFGLNFGASIVPYLTALVWDDTGHAYWLTLVTFLTMVSQKRPCLIF
jgi:fucose permease